MDRPFHNHMEVAPSTISCVSRYEDLECYKSQYGPLDHMGPIYYGELDCNPFCYGSLTNLQHPRSYIANTYQSYNQGGMTAPNVLPQQLYYNQQQICHSNLIPYQDAMPISRSSNYREGPTASNLEGTDDNPEMFEGSSFWVGSGDYRHLSYRSNCHNTIYSHNGGHIFPGDNRFIENQSHVHSISCHNEGCPFFYQSSPAHENNFLPSHDMVNVYSRHFYKRGCDCTYLNEGNIQDTYLRTSVSRSNILEMGIEDSWYIHEAPYRGFDNSISVIKPHGWGQPMLPNNVRSHKIGSSKQNFPRRQHGYKSRLKTNPSKSWAVASSSRAMETHSGAEDSGKEGKTQCNKLTHSSTDLASPSESKNQKVLVPKQVWKEKSKAQPSPSQRKEKAKARPCPNQRKGKTIAQPSPCQRKRSWKHSTPIFHITWDGFDKQPLEQVGQVCSLCNKDLSLLPTDGDDDDDDDDEFEYYYGIHDEPSKFPEVSVLQCGHAFHSHCLDQITPEEDFRDPPCCLCFSFES